MTPQDYFKIALAEAKLGLGTTYPNPLVGAVVVKDNKIIGQGHHEYSGGPHAEVNAINSSKVDVSGSDVYCTMEPCSHLLKKTPPCTEFLANKNIRAVHVISIDKNPMVNGRGLKYLEDNGIRAFVYEEFLKEEEEMNKIYYYSQKNQKPYIHLKWAESKEGFLCNSNYGNVWLTGQKSAKYVDQLRYEYSAILVGGNTVRVDNPELTIRFHKTKTPSPWCIVWGDPKSFTYNEKIFSKDRVQRTILLCSKKPSSGNILLFDRLGLVYFTTNEIETKDQWLCFEQKLFKIGINSILIEAGPGLQNFYLQNNFFQEVSRIQSSNSLGNGFSINTENLIGIKNCLVKLDEDNLFHYGRNMKA